VAVGTAGQRRDQIQNASAAFAHPTASQIFVARCTQMKAVCMVGLRKSRKYKALKFVV
jgi:hypothetical protein